MMSRLLDIDGETLRSWFDVKPFRISHHLRDCPLFTHRRLGELCRRLPERDVEYNAGDVPISLDPRLTPRTGLSSDETIRRIEECGSWMVLKNVQRDSEYRELLDRCLDEVLTAGGRRLQRITERRAFIFIASPLAVTPYHIDPEHNFLLQVRGWKTFSAFDQADRSLLSDRALEAFFSGAHRNLPFKDEYQEKASLFDLSPGDGLYCPVTTPHWVKNGDEVSISFSITFKTPASLRRGGVYRVNAWLRKRGLHPTPPGQSPPRDTAKWYGFRIFRRAQHVLSGWTARREGVNHVRDRRHRQF